jgi:hypothetical protein
MLAAAVCRHPLGNIPIHIQDAIPIHLLVEEVWGRWDSPEADSEVVVPANWEEVRHLDSRADKSVDLGTGNPDSQKWGMLDYLEVHLLLEAVRVQARPK